MDKEHRLRKLLPGRREVELLFIIWQQAKFKYF